MKSNSQTNRLIMLTIVFIDFVLLNILLGLLLGFHPWFARWTPFRVRTLLLLSNIALLISEYFNSPIIQMRIISAGDVVKRVLQLTLVQSFIAIVFMKSLSVWFVGGKFQLAFFALFFPCILLSRYIERLVIKKYRRVGGNLRHVTFIGADTELLNLYHKLNDDLAMGYRIDGYYADADMPVDGRADDLHPAARLEKLGTLQYFMENMAHPENLKIGDEIYVCLSRRDKDTITRISRFCDQHVVRFYFVPVSVETLGIDLKHELIDDMEVYATYENPLSNPLNKFVKRMSDIVMSILFLIPTALILPVVWIVM